MTTWLLEAYNTDSRYRDDVRYRAYTTSERKANAFNKIPKIQFTDSGHGIVFAATELGRGARRLEPRYDLADYVREHLKVEVAPKRKPKALILCGECRHWDVRRGASRENVRFAGCNNEKIVTYNSYHVLMETLDLDQAIAESDEGWAFLTGHEFGCVHGETRDDNV